MSYTVFTDFHHASLLKSLIILFEHRLGGKLYRPIGRDWYDKGFWKIYDHPATVAQFLDVGGATPDGTPKLNEIDGMRWPKGGFPGEPEVYFCWDIGREHLNNAITFDGFMRSHFDFVIASVPQHIEPFRRLCDMHPSHPKLIYQIGNEWNVEEHKKLLDGVLSSARVYLPQSIPSVMYHQEFDLKVFHRGDTEPKKFVTSFVNCFDTADIFHHDWLDFERIEHLMSPSYQFRAYGGSCRDGSADGATELAKRMREAGFIWHVKRGGDGYGHILHNAAAVGRPVIVKMGYYAGKLGGDLLIPDKTCIAIDGLRDDQIIEKIH